MLEMDIFGHPVQLFTAKSNTFTTQFSGLVSTVLMILLFNIYYSSVVEYVTKQKVTSYTAKSFDDQPTEIVMNGKNFMFAISLAQTDYIFNVRPYFNVTLQQSISTTNDNGVKMKNYTYLTMEPCTLKKFQNIFGQYGLNFSAQYSQLNVSQWLCPVDDFEIRLGGSFSNDFFEYTKIEISQCHNKTEKTELWNPVCAPIESVTNAKDFGITIYTISYIVDSQDADPDTFISPYLSDQLYFNFYPQKLYKAVDIYYREQNIVTDKSISYGTDYQRDSILYNEYKDFNERVDVTQPAIYSTFYFRRSYFTEDTQRQFQKFGDLVSYLGGFTGILIPLFGAFLQVYNKYAFIMYIANKIYYFNLKINGSDALSPMEENQQKSFNNLTQKQTSFGVNALDDIKSAKNQKTNIPNIFSKKQIVNFKDIMDEKIKIHPYESSESNHQQVVQKIDDSTIINENFFLVDQCIPSEQDRLGKQETQVKIINSNFFLIPNDTNDPPNNIQDRFSKIKLPKITQLPKERKEQIQTKPNQDINYDKIIPSKKITQTTQISKPFKLFKKIKGKLFAVAAMIKLNRKKAFAVQSSFNKLFSEFKHLRYTILWVINSLTYGLCFDNQQNKMINKTIQQIYSDLDLISLIKNNQELKKLKMIILQEKQLLLFNIQPRKIIKIAEEEEINLQDLKRASKKKSIVSNKDEPNYEYQQIQEAYQWCKCDQNMDEIQISINNKLIEALGDELKSTLAQIK